MFRIFTRQSVACSLTPVKWVFHSREEKDCETIQKLEILGKKRRRRRTRSFAKTSQRTSRHGHRQTVHSQSSFAFREGIAGHSLRGGCSVRTTGPTTLNVEGTT